MTRLAGDQLTLGAQMLYADLGFSIGQGTSPALGTQRRWQSGRVVPRWRHVLFAQRCRRTSRSDFAVDRQLRIGGEVRLGLGRPVPCAGGNAARRVDPSVGCVAHQRESLGGREPQRDVWQARKQGGRQQHHRGRRQPLARRQRVGLRRQPRAALRSGSRHTLRHHVQLAGQARISAHRRSGTAWRPESGRCSLRAGCWMPTSISASRSRRA